MKTFCLYKSNSGRVDRVEDEDEEKLENKNGKLEGGDGEMEDRDELIVSEQGQKRLFFFR